VAEAVAIAAACSVPIVAFGAGTSLEGHTNAPCGGISFDFSRMDRVLAVNADDLDCTVEAGVSRTALDRYLRDTGLFFPVDPGAGEASLGGMAATRASGTTSVRYGTMRDNVVRVTAVLADGRIVRTGSRARKSAAGYDLTRLLVGSEGTLGLITELTLRLYPRPEARAAAVLAFHSLDDACRATIAMLAAGLPVARVELLDAPTLEAVNAHAGLAMQIAPTLFVELHGSSGTLGADLDTLENLAREARAMEVARAEREADIAPLWRARHDAFWAVRGAFPGRSALVTDVCVPLSALAACVAETEADRDRLGLTAPIVGHVGDGNFHAIVLFDPGDRDEAARVADFVERLSARALAMDGTCTGEHGIGQGKQAQLAAEAGTALATMRAIKAALDPHGLLNPGKILGR
jgi:D-lactate dehydrogenase (cytochrome)